MNDRRDADGFDGVLSQMTEPDSSAAPDRKAPADRRTATDAPATAPQTPGREASNAARRGRVGGEREDADSPSTDGTAKSSKDEQTISATLSWLLAGMQAVSPPVSVPADTSGSDHPTGTDGENAGGDRSSAASGLSSSALAAGAANVQAQSAPGQPADRTEEDADASADRAVDPRPQAIDAAAIGTVNQASVPHGSGKPNPADLPAGRTATEAIAAARARALSAAKANDASSAAPVDGKTSAAAADAAGNSPRNSVAQSERASAASSAAVSRAVANAPDSNGAAAQTAGKSVAASSAAGAPVADARPADSHGSTRHDGAAAEERGVDVPPVRSVSSPATSHVFQLPADVRTVGGTTLAAAATEAATAVGIPPGHDIDLPKQIVQAIRLQWDKGVGDARITLQPEYLGEMSISIRVEHGAVSAELEASAPAVREWIDSHQPMLRQALAAQGLELQRLTTVDTPAASEEKRDRQSESQQQPQDQDPRQQRRRNRPDAPAFELIA